MQEKHENLVLSKTMRGKLLSLDYEANFSSVSPLSERTKKGQLLRSTANSSKSRDSLITVLCRLRALL